MDCFGPGFGSDLERVRLLDYAPWLGVFRGWESNRGRRLFCPQLCLPAALVAADIDSPDLPALFRSVLEFCPDAGCWFCRTSTCYLIWRRYCLKNVRVVVDTR